MRKYLLLCLLVGTLQVQAGGINFGTDPAAVREGDQEEVRDQAEHPRTPKR
jgi:hypothetical protein